MIPTQTFDQNVSLMNLFGKSGFGGSEHRHLLKQRKLGVYIPKNLGKLNNNEKHNITFKVGPCQVFQWGEKNPITRLSTPFTQL